MVEFVHGTGPLQSLDFSVRLPAVHSTPQLRHSTQQEAQVTESVRGGFEYAHSPATEECRRGMPHISSPRSFAKGLYARAPLDCVSFREPASLRIHQRLDAARLTAEQSLSLTQILQTGEARKCVLALLCCNQMTADDHHQRKMVMRNKKTSWLGSGSTLLQQQQLID